MFKALEGILNFLFHVSKMRDHAKRIKEDEEKRKKSIYFGVISIVYSLLSFGFCFAGAWLFENLLDSLLVIFIIIIGIGFMIGGLAMFVWSIVAWILQLSINRRFIGWLALVVFIAGIVGSVILVVGQLGSL
ncbi:MAG: hypothetical protein K2J85_03080 [Anaeroplasmataceae bacterium]|nr:hypothetical protein [Anaeroplasmataceae bacterium]